MPTPEDISPQVLDVSIVIPTCHRNDLLERCLDCLAPGVQTQTLAANRYEIVVSDDGSRSTARALIQEKHPWARWVSGPRRGPAANRNNGVRHARGEWIAFTDDDCLPASGWLQSYLSAVQADVLVYEGKTTCEAGVRSPLETAPVNLSGGSLWSCNMMIQKSLFDSLGGFDESFPSPHLEDVDFRERLRGAGHGFAFVESAVVDHPPRRIKLWSDPSMGAKSELFFWYKHGNTEALALKFLLRFARYHLRRISKASPSWDSVLALLDVVRHLHILTFRMHRWERRYRVSRTHAHYRGRAASKSPAP